MANTPTNTYKEVVELLQSICLSHLAVKQFQVGGDISDMDIQSNVNTFVRYPLVFLVPSISSMDRYGRLVLGFTFVVADIAQNEEVYQTDIHNNTMLIMQDIFSKIINTTWEEVNIELETPINFTFFVEKYNNNLAGVSAEINIIVKSPFNLCDAAFA